MLRFLTLIVLLAACEGPIGPVGPQGEQGVRGEQGEQGEQGVRGEQGERGRQSELVLIEQTMNPEDYDEDFTSYYIEDSRIRLATVVNVYVKSFYTNTGESYYSPFDSWSKHNASIASLQVVPSRSWIRLFDPTNALKGQTVLVVLAIEG